jgi:hypothetical protein
MDHPLFAEIAGSTGGVLTSTLVPVVGDPYQQNVFLENWYLGTLLGFDDRMTGIKPGYTVVS